MSALEDAASQQEQMSAVAAAEAASYGLPTSSALQSPRSSRRKRSLVFPTGSDLSFNVGISIPITALSATSESA